MTCVTDKKNFQRIPLHAACAASEARGLRAQAAEAGVSRGSLPPQLWRNLTLALWRCMERSELKIAFDPHSKIPSAAPASLTPRHSPLNTQTTGRLTGRRRYPPQPPHGHRSCRSHQSPQLPTRAAESESVGVDSFGRSRSRSG